MLRIALQAGLNPNPAEENSTMNLYESTLRSMLEHPWAQLVWEWALIAWQWVAKAHQNVIPWVGWCLVGLVLVLGPIWFWRALRMAGRSLRRWVTELAMRRRMLEEQIRRHLLTQEHFENCATPGLIEPEPKKK